MQEVGAALVGSAFLAGLACRVFGKAEALQHAIPQNNAVFALIAIAVKAFTADDALIQRPCFQRNAAGCDPLAQLILPDTRITDEGIIPSIAAQRGAQEFSHKSRAHQQRPLKFLRNRRGGQVSLGIPQQAAHHAGLHQGLVQPVGQVAGAVKGTRLLPLVGGEHGADDIPTVLVAHLHTVGVHQQDVVVVIFRDELFHIDLGILGVQGIHVLLQPVKELIPVGDKHPGGKAHILCLGRDGFSLIGLGRHHRRHAVLYRGVYGFLFAGIGVNIAGFLLFDSLKRKPALKAGAH